MIYQRFKKSGRVAKSQFLEKKLFNKKIKTDFFQKSTFFESPITHKRFIFEHSYISYGKRQKSCTLIVILVILSYLTSPIFNSSSKSTGFFFANEEVVVKPISMVCAMIGNLRLAKQGQVLLQHLPQQQQQQHQRHPEAIKRKTTKIVSPIDTRIGTGALHRWISVHDCSASRVHPNVGPEVEHWNPAPGSQRENK